MSRKRLPEIPEPPAVFVEMPLYEKFALDGEAILWVEQFTLHLPGSRELPGR